MQLTLNVPTSSKTSQSHAEEDVDVSMRERPDTENISDNHYKDSQGKMFDTPFRSKRITERLTCMRRTVLKWGWFLSQFANMEVHPCHA